MRNSSEIHWVYNLCWPSFAMLLVVTRFLTSLRNVLLFVSLFVPCWECDRECYMMYHHRLVCRTANKTAKFIVTRMDAARLKRTMLQRNAGCELSALCVLVSSCERNQKYARIRKRINKERIKTIKAKFIYRSCLLVSHSLKRHKIFFMPKKCWFCFNSPTQAQHSIRLSNIHEWLGVFCERNRMLLFSA